MEYADLRVLEVVARHGSMNRAADELNTVQSNVTARIRALEHRVGARLFERSSRGVRLTGAGERLLPYAARLASLLREAHEAARDDGTPCGDLRIGALETAAALRLPPILATYSRAWPEVRLSVTTGTSASLIADVLEHRLDGALVVGPVRHPDLAEEAFFREELMLVTAPALRDLDAVAGLRDLRGIVFRSGCSYRQRLESLLARLGLGPSHLLEFGSLEAILGCVAAGLGVTLLPRVVVMAAWREGRVAAHELPPAEARVETVFIRRRGQRMGSTLASFLAAVRPSPLRLAAGD